MAVWTEERNERLRRRRFSFWRSLFNADGRFTFFSAFFSAFSSAIDPRIAIFKRHNYNRFLIIRKGRMLSARNLQLFLISAVVLITVYFTFRLSKELFSYLPLKAQSSARVSQWEIEEIKGKFALKAAYTFEAEGAVWKNSTRFRPPYFWNEPSAITALKGKAKESWSAWYDPKNPAHSSLEKNFPAGLLFRTSVCYCVFIYFLLMKSKLIKILRN